VGTPHSSFGRQCKEDQHHFLLSRHVAELAYVTLGGKINSLCRFAVVHKYCSAYSISQFYPVAPCCTCAL
jgi:hypothetical protein